jgi:hypothetical protein
MKRLISLPALILAAAAVPHNVQAQPPAIKAIIDNNTILIARHDLKSPESDQATMAALAVVDMTLEAKSVMNARATLNLLASLRTLKCQEVWSIFNCTDRGIQHAFVIPLTPEIIRRRILELSPKDGISDWKVLAVGNAAVIAPSIPVQLRTTVEPVARKVIEEQWTAIKPVARKDLELAFAAADPGACQLCVAFSEVTRRALAELIPTLPAEQGGGSSTFLFRDMSWIAIDMGIGPTGGLHVTVQAKDDATAARLQKWLSAILTSTVKDTTAQAIWKDFSPLAAALAPTARDTKVVMNLNHAQTKSLFEPLAAWHLRRADYAINAECLKQLAIAMHIFLDSNKTFPTPASYDQQGKPLLSWRVHLLPFLGEQNLYDQFKLDEPWDSQNNKKLIAKMPAVYRHPLGLGMADGKTAVAVPLGPSTIFPGGKGITFQEITDGSSLTILLLQVADDNMVVWTKPDDWHFDPKQPRRGLPPEFYVAVADATVHRIGPGVSAATLQALMTRNGGDVVGQDFHEQIKDK